MQTAAMIKAAVVEKGEAVSASGMANGPWYAVPANIWAAISKEHTKSGGEQYIRSCSGENEGEKRRIIDMENKLGSVI